MTRVKISTKKSVHAGKHAKLILDDGTILEGRGFGATTAVTGEIVFNTGMVGYTETLTDPSYSGQILTLTYPLVGNYGVPDPAILDEAGTQKYFESGRIQARGLVIHELSLTASHWSLSMTLDEWLYKQNVPGISGIDTRALTKKLRDNGVMMSALEVSEDPIDDDHLRDILQKSASYDSEEFMGTVSTPEPKSYGSGDKTVVVIDTGVKNAIIRNICRLGYRAVVVPWNTAIDDISRYNPKGVVISNGPGDPQHCADTVRTAKDLIQRNIPTLGICLGAQIIGMAGGAKTYKLKYGHRGQNKPCLDTATGQVYVTSQNHGYCIDPESLKDSEFDLWFSNADDDTVEGIRHRKNRCIAVQFHPEASPGPYDCQFVFERLQHLMEEDIAKG